MSARDEILRAVRAARPDGVAHPDVRAVTSTFARSEAGPAELARRFEEAARASGAHVLDGERERAGALLASEHPEARRILSAVPHIEGATAAAGDDPHTLADLDLFVCEAVLGVAENGALWVPASRLGGIERAALFLATHVALLLDRRAIVADLHAAYDRLDLAGEAFGVFIAGPSKTADIEQSLVVGAHGPKGLTVVLLAE